MRLLRSFRHATRGLAYVWRQERNFRIHVTCAIAVLCASALLRFTFIETSLLVFAILLVLAAEMVNTIIEDAYDTVHPSHHELIGKVKDMMAGMVLLHAIGAVLIGALVFANHFWPLFS